MKITVFTLILGLVTFINGYCQIKDCERMYNDAKNLFSRADYKMALKKLSAAKNCNPLNTKYDSLIVEIYEEINQQRQIALSASEKESIARKDAERKKDSLQKQLVLNFWNNSRTSIKENNFLASLHFTAEAVSLSNNNEVIRSLLIDIDTYLPQTQLKNILSIEKAINLAKFSADGKLVLTISKDSTVRVFNAVTRKLAGPPIKHDSEVISAVFNTDGSKVLTASGEGTARIWQIATGEPKGNPMQGVRTLSSAAFSKDGKKILTVDFGMNTAIWDADTGEKVGRLVNRALSADYSTDGKRILTTNPDSTARLWHASTTFKKLAESLQAKLSDSPFLGWYAIAEQQIGPEMKHSGPVNGAVLHPNGTQVMTISSNRIIRFWDTGTGNPIGTDIKLESDVISAVFSSDGKVLLTANSDLTARLWDVKSRKPFGLAMKHDGDVFSAVFSPNGKFVLTASKDRSARIWNSGTGEPIGSPMRHEGPVNNAVFSEDGKQILTASSDGTVRIWDLASARPQRPKIKLEYAGSGAVFSSDAKKILTTGSGNTAYIWNASTGKLAGSGIREEDIISTTASYSSAVFSHDGKKVLTASNDHKCKIWDAITGKQIGTTIKHNNRISRAVFSPNGKMILTCSWDSSARLWNAHTQRQIGQAMKHNSYVFDAVFSPDGKKVLTASQDGTARLWYVVSGKPTGIIMKHESDVISAVFSPDGKHILTSSKDLTARLWDASIGMQIGAAMNHEFDVYGADFSPDGKFILTASKDKSARVWDVGTRKQIGPPMLHEDAVNSAVFSPDGKKILTAGWEGTAYLWDLEADIDLTADLFKLQVKVISGCELNTVSNELQLIQSDLWYALKEEYHIKAREHYKKCRYPEYNLWQRFFRKEAEQIRPKEAIIQIPEAETASILNNHGMLYSQHQDFSKAEMAFLESLSIRGRLAAINPQLYEKDLAETQTCLGILYKDAKKFDQAEQLLIESFTTHQKLIKLYPEAYTKITIEIAINILNLYLTMMDSFKYESFKRDKFKNFAAIEHDLNNLSIDDLRIKSDLFVYYSNSSWYLLFASKYIESEQSARKAIQLYPSQIWVKTNLAHSLLFQGRFEEAVKIYAELKPLKDQEEKSFAVICLEDLDELEKNGLKNEGINKVRALLKE